MYTRCRGEVTLKPQSMQFKKACLGTRSRRLAGLEQRTPRDLQTAVRLLFQRVERLPGFTVVVDDMNALRDVAVGCLRLAEFKTPVAIDRRIALLDHQHED